MNILRLNKGELEATLVQRKDKITYNITAGKEVQQQEEVTASGKINETYVSSVLKTLLNDGFILTEIITN